MQATQVRQPFHREGWVYEEKIDGWCLLAYKEGRAVRLESRNGVDHTRRFPEFAAAVATRSGRKLVLDGEVAIFDRQLRSRFDRLRDPDPEEVARPPLLMCSTCSIAPRFDGAPAARSPRPIRGAGG
jgi:bifunctional non-homologous end joining protein LigD